MKYNELKNHIKHKLSCKKLKDNVVIMCETCEEILFEISEDEREERIIRHLDFFHNSRNTERRTRCPNCGARNVEINNENNSVFCESCGVTTRNVVIPSHAFATFEFFEFDEEEHYYE